MELRHYLVSLQRRWWLVVLGTLLAGVTAYAVSKQITPTYRAQATLLLNLASQQVPTYNDVTASQSLTKTYARLITAYPTLEEAARRLGNGVTADSLGKVSGTDVPLTELLQVSFESGDPNFAAQVANTVAQVFAERVKLAQTSDVTQSGTSTPATGISSTTPVGLNTIFLVEPARVPTHPVSPRVGLTTAAAAVVGLLLSLILARVLSIFDDKVRDPLDLERLGLPLMGTLPHQAPPMGAPLSVLSPEASRGPLAEGYRQLRTNVEFAAPSGRLSSLVVTSARPREGRTTTAANLAIMIARAGRCVTLVDSDLRHPSLHTFFQLLNNAGLTTAFQASEQRTPEQLAQKTSVPNLLVLTSGPLPANPGELLASRRMGEIMASLAESAEVVVYDSPPSGAVNDAAVIAAHTDGVLLVLDAGKVSTKQVQQAVDRVTRTRGRMLGGVLNKLRSVPARAV